MKAGHANQTLMQWPPGDSNAVFTEQLQVWPTATPVTALLVFSNSQSQIIAYRLFGDIYDKNFACKLFEHYNNSIFLHAVVCIVAAV